MMMMVIMMIIIIIIIMMMMIMMTLLQIPSLGVQFVMLSLCFLKFYRLPFEVNYLNATLMFIKVFSTIVIIFGVW